MEHVGAGHLDEESRVAGAGRTPGHLRRHHGYDAAIDLRYLFSKQYSVLGSFMGTMGELHTALKFVFPRANPARD